MFAVYAMVEVGSPRFYPLNIVLNGILQTCNLSRAVNFNKKQRW